MNQELTLEPDAGKQAALASLIEALLLASEMPLSLADLQRMIGSETPVAALSEALARLQ